MQNKNLSDNPFMDTCLIVCKEFDVPLAEMLSKRRGKALTARQCAQYIIRTHFEFSYPQIADMFELSDHTTIMHSCKRVKEVLLSDPDFQRKYNASCLKLNLHMNGRMHIILKYAENNIPYFNVTALHNQVFLQVDRVLEPLGYRLGLKKLEKKDDNQS